MDEMVYVAMTGAKQTEVAQAINSNNLANVSTSGFRSDLHAFSSRPVEGPGAASRVNAVVDGYGTDLAHGALASGTATGPPSPSTRCPAPFESRPPGPIRRSPARV